TLRWSRPRTRGWRATRAAGKRRFRRTSEPWITPRQGAPAGRRTPDGDAQAGAGGNACPCPAIGGAYVPPAVRALISEQPPAPRAVPARTHGRPPPTPPPGPQPPPPPPSRPAGGRDRDGLTSQTHPAAPAARPDLRSARSGRPTPRRHTRHAGSPAGGPRSPPP